ncbi:MAG: 6-phosphofructokinase, partial [Clostridiales bacterium]|nr:6-phosphofructokinase [Clostridiales bacterium]
EEEFLEDVQKWHEKLGGGVVVVVSEGLKDKKGSPIVPPIFQTGRAIYYGDVSTHLAGLIIKRLGIKARSEKPGICGRASIAFQSEIDRNEAITAGKEAVKAAARGKSGVMVGFERQEGNEYKCKTILIPIEEVMLHEKKLPDNYINQRGNDVTEDFIKWCKPLIGDELREFFSFK